MPGIYLFGGFAPLMHLAVGIAFELVPRSFMEEHPAVFPDHLTNPGNMNYTILRCKEGIDHIRIILQKDIEIAEK